MSTDINQVEKISEIMSKIHVVSEETESINSNDDNVESVINKQREEDSKQRNMRSQVPSYREKMRTAPCDSIGTSNDCRHGAKCCFAHNKQEFRPQECRFGERCKAVYRYSNNVYYNSRNCTKLCIFIHPCESINSACERLEIPDQVRKLIEPKRVELLVLQKQDPSKQLSVVLSSKQQKTILTLNVSKKEVLSVVEQAIKDGFHQFNVNVID